MPGALLQEGQSSAPIRQDEAVAGVDISCGKFHVHVTEAAPPALPEMVLQVTAHFE